VAQELARDQLIPIGAILTGPHWPGPVRVVRAASRGGSRVLVEAITLDDQLRLLSRLFRREELAGMVVQVEAGVGSVELSANEWLKAEQLGDEYWLYVVTDTLGVAKVMEQGWHQVAARDRKNFDSAPSELCDLVSRFAIGGVSAHCADE
jgi:hypothetical protein